MATATEQLAKLQDIETYQELNWTGTFDEYLDIVRENPRVTRTAWRRLYDMVISHGVEEYTDNRKKVQHYGFFDDPFEDGRDAIFGMDITLMKLVNTFKSAAFGFGVQGNRSAMIALDPEPSPG